MAVALDHLLAAHVKGYDVIHRLQPDATVTTNNFSLSLYELDRMLIDILTARRQGVSRDDLGSWIALRRSEWYGSIAPPARSNACCVGRPSGSGSEARDLHVPSTRCGPAPHQCTLDVVGIDYYAPVAAHHVRLPGRRTAGGRSWQPGNELWDDPVEPGGLVEYARANVVPGLDLWIVENGICNRVRRGRSFPRLDGWDRVRYLRATLAALVDAIDDGVPVGGVLPLVAHGQLRVGELRAALRDPRDRSGAGSAGPRHRCHGVRRRRCLPADHRRTPGRRPLRAGRSLLTACGRRHGLTVLTAPCRIRPRSARGRRR